MRASAPGMQFRSASHEMDALRSRSAPTSCDRKTGFGSRTKRLYQAPDWWCPVVDFTVGAGPWLLAVGAAAAGLTALIEHTEGTGQWMKDNLANEAALTALSSMLSFLVVARISANLSQNASVVGMFGSLCGSTVGLALNLRGLATHVRNEEGCTSKLGVVIASLPHAAYHKAAGHPEEDLFRFPGPSTVPAYRAFIAAAPLPICDDEPGAYADFLKLKRATKLPVFETLMLQATSYIQDLEKKNHVAVPKVGILMKGLNAIADIEGNLSGTLGFEPARIIDIVVYMLFVLYYLLLLIATLIPQSSWSSIWVSMIVVLSTAGLYGISARLKNPFRDRGGGQNQRSSVRKAVLDTEKQVTAVMDSLASIQIGFASPFACAP